MGIKLTECFQSVVINWYREIITASLLPKRLYNSAFIGYNSFISQWNDLV